MAYIRKLASSCISLRYQTARSATVFVLPADSPSKRERARFGDITLRMSPTMSACMLSMTGFVGHLMSTRNRGLWIASTAAGFFARNAVRSSKRRRCRFTVGLAGSIEGCVLFAAEREATTNTTSFCDSSSIINRATFRVVLC